MLPFDEAHSLFARRTEVKSSNDRYGNLAVNYLLQRLEQYSGVAVLTTNKEAALDEALQRRLSLHLRLEIPEPPERERLWRTKLSAVAPQLGDIDFARLAKEFELAWGYIKNVAVRAAFLAAGDDVPIHMALLRHAAALELEDQGRESPTGPGLPHGMGGVIDADIHRAGLECVVVLPVPSRCPPQATLGWNGLITSGENR